MGRIQVYIRMEDGTYERTLANIVSLFYEDVQTEVGPEPKEKAELTINLSFHMEEAFVTAEAQLSHRDGGEASAGHTRVIPASTADDHRRRFVRQALSYVLLDVLQQHTGLVQPWGILTGIRPTKLLHERNRRGAEQSSMRKELREDYLIREEKIELMERIVEQQLRALPDLYSLKDEVSIYIGIPFCPTKCAYCTFPAYDINGRQGSVGGFLHGLHYEIREVGRWLRERGIRITTIYFGGGTPTSITAEEMDALYHEMYESFPDVESVREITVEAGRPDTITPEKLTVLRKWGIDRISINPQSYTQATLELIGRHHTVKETIDKYGLARSFGMDNINMDLIIGLPGEGEQEFDHTLAETAKLLPESLTVHTLSFKRASEMTRHRTDGTFIVAGRDEVTRMMERASAWTKAHGYVPYYLYRQKNILGNLENVGYAKPGMESLYNILIIEEMQTIIGLGCGASSKFVDPKDGSITRLANPKEPKAYNESYLQYTELKLKELEKLFGAANVSIL